MGFFPGTSGFPGGYWGDWFNISPSSGGNIASGTNDPYTSDNFYATFPHFKGVIDVNIVDMFVPMANAAVNQGKWNSAWSYGMALFIAHFATLYLQTLGDSSSPDANAVIANAQARGLQTSESVGEVSVSQDFSTIANDLKGWAAWNLTSYGQQFATFAKMTGKGGMYVY